jgi:translation elongation factor EF-Tu-like GTPase
MGWKFWKRSNPMDPQEMLARGHASSFPGPPRPQDSLPVGSFGMTVEDVFSITGRGTVVTGRVQTGAVTVGEQVLLSRAGQPMLQVEVAGVEMFRKTVQTAKAGDNVGLLLRGITRDQVLKGDVVSK